MHLANIQHAIKAVAKSHGVSEKQVIEDINYIIAETYSLTQKNGDLKSLSILENIPKEDALPTAYEFVDYLANAVIGEVQEANLV